MTAIEDLTKEVSHRKMHGLKPLLGEIDAKLWIHVRILDIWNCCITAAQHHKFILVVH